MSFMCRTLPWRHKTFHGEVHLHDKRRISAELGCLSVSTSRADLVTDYSPSFCRIVAVFLLCSGKRWVIVVYDMPRNRPIRETLLLLGVVPIKLFSAANPFNGELNFDRLWREGNTSISKGISPQRWPTLCSGVVVTCQSSQCRAVPFQLLQPGPLDLICFGREAIQSPARDVSGNKTVSSRATESRQKEVSGWKSVGTLNVSETYQCDIWDWRKTFIPYYQQ